MLRALKICISDYTSVKREFKHTDITFFDASDEKCPTLIIENKMKSLPDGRQLNLYLDKFYKKETGDREKHIVLLLPYSYVPEDVRKFTIITYKMLGECMKQHIALIEDDFTKALTTHYADFIIALYDSFNLISKPDFDNTTIAEYFDRKSELMIRFEALRLSSIVWKLRMAYLADALTQRLAGSGITIAANAREYNKNSRSLLIGTSISNNKPILDCFMYLNDEVEFGIQLDNGVYNHGIVIHTDDAEAIKLKKSQSAKLQAKIELLKNIPEGLADTLLSELGIKKDDFLSYNNMFYSHRHKAGQLESRTLNDVLNEIADEIHYILNKYPTIKK